MMTAKEFPKWFPQIGEKIRWEWNKEIKGYIGGEQFSGEGTVTKLFTEKLGDDAVRGFSVETSHRIISFACQSSWFVASGPAGDSVAVCVFRVNGKEIDIAKERAHDSHQAVLRRQLGITEDSELALVELPDVGDTLIIRGCRRTETIAIKCAVTSICYMTEYPMSPIIVTLDVPDLPYLKYSVRKVGKNMVGAWCLVPVDGTSAASWVVTFEVAGK